MTIVGFSLTKILLERKETIIKKTDIKSKLQVTSVAKQDLKVVEGKDIIRFDFEYDIEYSPDLALISFKGYLLFAADPKVSEEIMKNWKKSKTISRDLQESIYNFIFHKCNIKALQLEDEYNLPIHLQLPQLKLDETKEKK